MPQVLYETKKNVHNVLKYIQNSNLTKYGIIWTKNLQYDKHRMTYDNISAFPTGPIDSPLSLKRNCRGYGRISHNIQLTRINMNASTQAGLAGSFVQSLYYTHLLRWTYNLYSYDCTLHINIHTYIHTDSVYIHSHILTYWVHLCWITLRIFSKRLWTWQPTCCYSINTTLLQHGERYKPIKSIGCLLTPWPIISPTYQHPWYCSYETGQLFTFSQPPSSFHYRCVITILFPQTIQPKNGEASVFIYIFPMKSEMILISPRISWVLSNQRYIRDTVFMGLD